MLTGNEIQTLGAENRKARDPKDLQMNFSNNSIGSLSNGVYGIATLTFKALHTGRPPYLSDLLHYYEPIRSCLLYTSPSPRDRTRSRMPSSA